MFYIELTQADVRDMINLHLLYIARLLESISSLAHYVYGLTKRVVDAVLYGAAGEGASASVTCARLRDLCCALRCLTRHNALISHIDDEWMLKACFSASTLTGYPEAAEETMNGLIALAKTLTRAQRNQLFEATAKLFEDLEIEACMQLPVDKLHSV